MRISSRSSSRVSNSEALGGELVVELGEILLAHLLDGDRKARGPPGQLVGLVVVGEGHVDRALVARGGAGERRVELGQQVLRPELDHEVARLRPLERLTLDGAGVVDHDRVAGGRGAIDGREARKALAQAVELGLHGVVGNLGLRLADLESRAIRQASAVGRTPTSIENSSVLALGGQLADVELRVADRRPGRRRRRARSYHSGRRVRAAPAPPPPRARFAGSRAVAAPFPFGSRASSSRPPVARPRGRCPSRQRRAPPRRRSSPATRGAL